MAGKIEGRHGVDMAFRGERRVGWINAGAELALSARKEGEEETKDRGRGLKRGVWTCQENSHR